MKHGVSFKVKFDKFYESMFSINPKGYRISLREYSETLEGSAGFVVSCKLCTQAAPWRYSYFPGDRNSNRLELERKLTCHEETLLVQNTNCVAEEYKAVNERKLELER